MMGNLEQAVKQLREHRASNAPMDMRAAFAADPERFDRFSIQLDDLLLDYAAGTLSETAPPAPAPETPVAKEAPPKQEQPAQTSPSPQKKSIEIKSPMVGTFYSAPSPDVDPYIKVGDTVSSGQVLCIIEAMILMNEIEAEFSCRIVTQVLLSCQYRLKSCFCSTLDGWR